MITVGSLFSGIGGIELGLERTGGFKTIWHCEIDAYASAVLKKHWPDVPNLGDITKVDWDGIKKPDMLCGGFPCQDISVAGKGKGIEGGHRSGLWFEYAKAIGKLRPRIALIENVPAIVGRGLDIVLADLAEMRYDAEWFSLSAAEVGAWHKRERLFIISYPAGERCDLRSGSGEERRVFSTQERKMAQEGAERDRWRVGAGENGSDVPNTPCFLLQGFADRQRERQSGRGGWWATEPDVGRVANGIPSRVDRIKCLGNAVVPQVAEVIGEMILGMENASPPPAAREKTE